MVSSHLFLPLLNSFSRYRTEWSRRRVPCFPRQRQEYCFCLLRTGPVSAGERVRMTSQLRRPHTNIPHSLQEPRSNSVIILHSGFGLCVSVWCKKACFSSCGVRAGKPVSLANVRCSCDSFTPADTPHARNNIQAEPAKRSVHPVRQDVRVVHAIAGR